MNAYKIIETIDEVTELDAEYSVKLTTKYNPFHFFEISKDHEGYMIYGHVSGDMPTSVCKGTYVKTWKTLNGIKRAIKTFSKNGYWGFFKWFPKENK